jgi:hypothetical protein
MLFVDGISRSGKKLTCKVVSYLEGVDYFQYASLIENTAYLQALGHMELVEAARFIRFNIDEIIYNRAIGRNLNTRESDETSVTRSPDADVYFRRAKAPDGQAAVDRFNAEGRSALFHTHSVLAFFDVLFEAYPTLRLIHVTRHPVDIAEDWLRRGWGERWGVDSLAFNITAETQAGVVPWYAVEWANAYQDMTPAERCIEAVVRLQEADARKLQSLDGTRKKQVHQFAFENLVTGPETVVKGLSKFVGAKPHGKMADLLESENCPAALPLKERRDNLKKLKSGSSDSVIARLLHAAGTYETAWSLDAVA